MYRRGSQLEEGKRVLRARDEMRREIAKTEQMYETCKARTTETRGRGDGAGRG